MSTLGRPFSLWRHFTTTTIIPFVFSLLCNLVQWNPDITMYQGTGGGGGGGGARRVEIGRSKLKEFFGLSRAGRGGCRKEFVSIICNITERINKTTKKRDRQNYIVLSGYRFKRIPDTTILEENNKKYRYIGVYFICS